MAKQKPTKISAKKQIELDIIYKPLIGKQIEIIDSKNKNQIGLIGTILFESSNLFYIEIKPNQIKKILKKDIIIQTTYKEKKININCSILQNDLVARLKKLK